MHHTDPNWPKLPKTDPKFKIGQKVVFVNDYGVNFGEKTVSDYEWDDIRGHTYQYEPNETPWYKTNERNLFAVEDVQGIANKTKVKYQALDDGTHYQRP